MNHLTHIADRVLNRPLMVMPDKLALIAGVLEGRIGIDAVALKADAEALPMPDASRHVGTFEPDPTSSTGARKPYRTTKNGIAIVPVLGSLVGRGGWLQAASGITSYENLRFQISAAAKDPAVKSILLDVDSPGGEAIGAFETADVVRAAAQVKPVIAVATGLMCSAAYAIASAATQIITTKSSVVGSIGVVMLHADYSHRLHEAGVVPTLIHAGKKKVDGSPYKPLTDDVKASLKAEVEKFNSLFVATVAENRRGLSRRSILAMEAGTYIGADAVAAGLADAVGSFEGVLATFGGKVDPTPANRRPQVNFLQTALDVQTAATASVDRVTQILIAGETRGLQKAAKQLALMPPEVISTESALALLAISEPNAAPLGTRAGDTPFGLVFSDDAAAVVRGHGLICKPATDADHPSDHGWNDVISALKRQGKT